MRYVSLVLFSSLFLIFQSNKLESFSFRDSQNVPIIKSAAQDQMEAGTIENRVVVPKNLQYSPGMAKAWIIFDMTVPSNLASYNVSSITDNGVGDFTINFTNAFSISTYTYALSTKDNADNFGEIASRNESRQVTTTSFPILSHFFGTSADVTDSNYISAVFFGDQ